MATIKIYPKDLVGTFDVIKQPTRSLKKVLCYRIENRKNGYGPFRGHSDEDLGKRLREFFSYETNRRHSRPTIDVYGADSYMKARDYLFACSSLRELIDYFGEELIGYMINNNFRIIVYQVKQQHTLDGDGEIAFDRTFVDKKYTARVHKKWLVNH